MLVVVNNEKYIPNWSTYDDVEQINTNDDFVIIIDPSKTNMAVVVASKDCRPLIILEFSGNNRRRGPAMDTTLYCNEVIAYLTKLIGDHNLYYVGIEQAIQKKGAQYYTSQMVLTEIRGSLLNFFTMQYGIQVREINNWSWKAGVLPQGFRSPFEKGSKKWFLATQPDSPLCQYFEADVTDVICMLMYVRTTDLKGVALFCNKVEKALRPFRYTYVGASSNLFLGCEEVEFNSVFTVEQNATYYTNRLTTPFAMNVPMTSVDVHDVYGRTIDFNVANITDDNVRVVVIPDECITANTNVP